MFLNILLIFVPASFMLAFIFHAPELWVFLSAIIALIPLAEWVRRATEHIARGSGPAVGGLFNVTFGNSTELVLALFILMQGHDTVVKAQITGSLIGNGLLGLGLAVLVGGWGRKNQVFNADKAGHLTSMLLLTLIAVLVPALFDFTERGLLGNSNPAALDEKLSLSVSVVLILVYIANLVYTLVTHRDVFEIPSERIDPNAQSERVWPLWRSLAILIVATVISALEADLVADTLNAASTQLGVSQFFMGIILLAVVGNAAEYFSAIYFARQDKMDLAMGITVGSSVQIVLLVAPLLVILSYFLGKPMNLVFNNPLELVAVMGVAFAVNAIAKDGETSWFEGMLLLSVYTVLGLAFFYVIPR